MSYSIIDTSGVCIYTASTMPDADDLASRGEVVVSAVGGVGDVWDGSAFSKQTITVTADLVRAEANRRILLVARLEEQLNMERRLRELGKLESLGQDMTGYQAEIALINDKFTEVDRLRDQSNILEVTLPADYADDIYW